jgi:hypothetical protein
MLLDLDLSEIGNDTEIAVDELGDSNMSVRIGSATIRLSWAQFEAIVREGRRWIPAEDLAKEP